VWYTQGVLVADTDTIRKKYAVVRSFLDERGRRLWAAAEARALGWGGVTTVAEATGLTRPTIHAGLRELADPSAGAPGRRRARRPGAGRKPLTQSDPGLLSALEALVEPTARGDPQSPLRWTCKSTRQVARTLTRQGHPISAQTVADSLRSIGYSLQGTRKTLEGSAHPDRDAQFRHIARKTARFLKRRQPVISVDTKKKELIGRFANAGQEWQPKGKPEPVNVHDFKDDDLGKVVPHGVYDPSANAGWVTVGVDHDTPAFAVGSIRSWWRQMGRRAYPQAKELLITADCGGSNSYRARAWKKHLQEFANESKLAVSVSHFPPGTSKWNKIEHRLFCHITQNWRGRPLVSQEAVVKLIGATTTQGGLKVRVKLDRRQYHKGETVTKAEMAMLNLKQDTFHGEWNYTLVPRCEV
jgi:hypothetical protein